MRTPDSTSGRRGSAGSPSSKRARPTQLHPDASRFFGGVYPSARAGCCNLLRSLGCSEDEAEEIFMATCEHVLRTVDPISRAFDPAQMVNLMKLACRRRLIDDRRHRRVLTEVTLDAAGPLTDSSAAGPYETLEDREVVEVAREAIASLPPLDRKVFCQRHLEGLTPVEIRLRNPSLTPRSYRRVIERANAHAMGSYAEIESGGRCSVIQRKLLPLTEVGDASPEASQLVEVHLRHCIHCRSAKVHGSTQDETAALGAGSRRAPAAAASGGSVPS